MISEQTILTAERLREDLENLRREIRRQYKKKTSQVTSDSLRTRAARLSEIWLVEIATDGEAVTAIGSEMTANLSVHFQRVLTFTERATIRGKYEGEIGEILNGYSLAIVLPLKQARGKTAPAVAIKKDDRTSVLTAFVGQSFSKKDKEVNEFVFNVLELIGVKAVTGERPKADYISEKVKRLIEEQHIFVGIFTCRDKLANKPEWTTSSWVIDEKAYALGRQKRLILLKEEGVGSIGGIQGRDYEYLNFSRDRLGELALGLLGFFEVINRGLRA
jgi:hypothetical protein